MVERTPSPLSKNLTPIGATPASVQPPRSGNGWFWAFILVLVILVAKLGSSSSGTHNVTAAAEATSEAQTALGTAVATQAPPPVEALSRTSVGLGATRVALATKEGLAGEMIYSQNCYDALGRQFSWRKLDQCGGFDVEASKLLGDAEGLDVTTAEAAWFGEEAAAGRYLKAATAAGESAEDADKRLAVLQAQIARRHPVEVEPATQPTDVNIDDATDDVMVNAEV